MATKSKASDAGEKQKKTVTIIAYAPHQAFKSARHLADELDASIDYYERKRYTTRTVELVLTDDDDDGHEHRQTVYDRDIADALVADGVGHDHLSVEEETEVSKPYAHNPKDWARSLRAEVAAALPDDLGHGAGRPALYSYKWQNDDYETVVQVRVPDIDQRRVLLHRSERDGRRKWQTDRKHLSVEFTVEFGAAATEAVTDWSEVAVPAVVQNLYGRGWVERVRVADCTETFEREGDCFEV